MALGLTGKKSSTVSQSYGYSGSESASFSQQHGGSLASAAGQSTSSQGLAFEDIFQQLYGGAAATAAGLSGQGLGDQARALFSGGMGFLDALGGGAGREHMQARLGQESPFLQDQIGALSQDLGAFFREELNPAITSQAVGGGALGGGRQGVAQGKAIDAVAREFQQGVTGLRSADLQQRDQLARDLMSGDAQAAGTGLSSLQAMLGLAEAGEFASLAPYAALGGILGGPTVLTQAQSSQVSEAVSWQDAIAQAISSAFGEDFASSKSKSKEAGISGLKI